MPGPAFSIAASDGKWRKPKTALRDFPAEKNQDGFLQPLP
jgi:hypothetical protein